MENPQFDLVPGGKQVLTVAVGDKVLELIEQASVMAEKADKYYAVTDQPHAELTLEFRARLKKMIDQLDAERLEMGAGARETLAKINEKFNAKLEPMRQVLSKVDGGLLAWNAQQRKEREEAERKAREELLAKQRAEAEAARAAGQPEPEVVAPPPVPAAPAPMKIQGTYGAKGGTREVWKWRIVNFGKVPKQYRKPPEECVEAGALTALAKAKKGDASVPGIEFYCEDVITSRVTV